MKKILLSLASLVIMATCVLGQQNIRNCGMQEHMTQLLQDEEYKEQHNQMLRDIQVRILKQEGERNCPGTIMIPMAVHYQRLKGRNYDENCLIQLAQNQIDILNQDYGGYNVDISNWTNNASSYFPGISNGEACIEFCLATSNHPSGYGLNEGDPAVTFNQTNGDSDGNWSGYINIFVRSIQYLGYSPYGGQGNGDGVVIDNNAFGSGNGCGSVSPNAPYNLGRTLTHELGHYLLLHHIWGTGNYNSPNCNDSDLVDDTPNQSLSYGGCPALGASSCGSNDMHMNFMDYTNDACMYMFSADQATRMEVYANSNLNNVIQNGLVVCGGTPPEPTCSDGEQNGDETGIDCGGSVCDPCDTGGCNAPNGLSATKQRGGSQLLLEWNNVSAANSYDVDIRESGTTNWNSYSTNTNSITITGLKKKSSYEWRVRSVCSDGISAWSNGTAQTREASAENEINVFPNPSNDKLFVTVSGLTLNTNKEIEITIIDLTGRKVFVTNRPASHNISVDVSSLATGSYILTLELENKVQMKKFTVLR